MLLSLHIRNFAIIDELEIDFAPGMTALTGETGAGKSILLGALGLLLGDRADAASVRHGCARAEISALFDVAALPAVQAWLAEQALEAEGECQLRRSIAREGRSRAYINGTPVPVQSLRELGERLVDIHGQHEHQSLMRPAVQRQLLDAHGDHAALLETLADTFSRWQRTCADIEALTGGEQDRDTRLEFLRFQCRELDELALGEDELRELHEEHGRLANAGTLIETCERCLAQLYDDDAHAAQAVIARARADIAGLAAIDPALDGASECLDNALVQMQEAVDSLRHYRQRLELDPDRLAWLEQRLEQIHDLARKHRVEAEALPALHRRLADELASLEHADERLDALLAERDRLRADYDATMLRLHRARCKTAQAFGKAVTAAMQELGMEGGRFEIAVETRDDATPAAQGTDRIEYRVSANPGQPPLALTRVASGGELSRISLAIQVIAARNARIPTLIFDEVDAGVGGATAETVGRLLRTLGDDRQVLCVTHLPQVAAQAHHHLQVSKLKGEKTTRTRVRALTGNERTEEIARMLGGRRITTQTREHAAEMLALAASPAKKRTPS